MKPKLQFYARQSGKRACVKARRLTAMLKAYQSDPVRNYRLRSESARLAKRVSYCLRQAELVGRISLTMEDDKRQAF